ncbi:MAG: hypothetical protein AB7G39_05130 [Alphaproteobacteria bacterium]
MSTNAADDMPTVPEAEATGIVADIYEDMRRTLGIPVINLVWRHFAALPDGLQWAWETARPLYASGAVAKEAAAFRAAFTGPALPAIPADVLAAVGVNETQAATLARVLDTYNLGNSQNMLGLRALYAALDGAASPEAALAATAPTVPERVEGEIPPILAMHELDAETAELVRRLNRICARDGGGIMVSLYRHLGYWPGFLALAWGLLAPLEADGRLMQAIEGAEAKAKRQAAALAGTFGSPSVQPDRAVLDDIRATINDFTGITLAKMVPIGLMLRRALPQ